MNERYASRGGIKITKVTMNKNSGDRVDWLDAFADGLESISKSPLTAVEQARARNEQSLLDQISNIMSRKVINLSSVEDKVQEYQDKTGLKEYIRRMSVKEQERKKIAQEESVGELPENFNKFSDKIKEDIKTFIRNKCETHHGNIQVPALVEEVSRTFRQVGIQPQDVNDMYFEKFVSDQIAKAKKQNQSYDEHHANLGLGVGVDNDHIDSANLDIFQGLTPVKSS